MTTLLLPSLTQHSFLQVILVGGKQNASIKARHGLTPPMRDAARRMLDQNPAVDQKLMQKLEEDLLTIAQVLHTAEHESACSYEPILVHLMQT